MSYNRFLRQYERNTRKCAKTPLNKIVKDARNFVHKNYNLIHNFQQRSNSLTSQEITALRSIRNSSELHEYEDQDNLEHHLKTLLDPRRASSRKQSQKFPSLALGQLSRELGQRSREKHRGFFQLKPLKQPTLQSQASIEMNILNSLPSNSNLNPATLQLFKKSMELINLTSDDTVERSPARIGQRNSLLSPTPMRRSFHVEEQLKDLQGSLSQRGSFSRRMSNDYMRKLSKEIEEIDYMEEDTVKNYEIYFPHNNITKIIDEIEKKQRKENRLKKMPTGNVILEAKAEEIKENLGLNIGKFIKKQALRSSIGPMGTPRLSSVSKTPQLEKRALFRSSNTSNDSSQESSTPMLSALGLRPITRMNVPEISKEQDSPFQKLSRFANPAGEKATDSPAKPLSKFAKSPEEQATANSPGGKLANEGDTGAVQETEHGLLKIPLGQEDTRTSAKKSNDTTPKNAARVDPAALIKKLRNLDL